MPLRTVYPGASIEGFVHTKVEDSPPAHEYYNPFPPSDLKKITEDLQSQINNLKYELSEIRSVNGTYEFVVEKLKQDLLSLHAKFSEMKCDNFNKFFETAQTFYSEMSKVIGNTTCTTQYAPVPSLTSPEPFLMEGSHSGERIEVGNPRTDLSLLIDEAVQVWDEKAQEEEAAELVIPEPKQPPIKWTQVLADYRWEFEMASEGSIDAKLSGYSDSMERNLLGGYLSYLVSHTDKTAPCNSSSHKICCNMVELWTGAAMRLNSLGYHGTFNEDGLRMGTMPRIYSFGDRLNLIKGSEVDFVSLAAEMRTKWSTQTDTILGVVRDIIGMYAVHLHSRHIPIEHVRRFIAKMYPLNENRVTDNDPRKYWHEIVRPEIDMVVRQYDIEKSAKNYGTKMPTKCPPLFQAKVVGSLHHIYKAMSMFDIQGVDLTPLRNNLNDLWATDHVKNLPGLVVGAIGNNLSGHIANKLGV